MPSALSGSAKLWKPRDWIWESSASRHTRSHVAFDRPTTIAHSQSIRVWLCPVPDGLVKPAALHITARQAVDFALARSGISQPFHEPLAAIRAMVAVQAQYSASVPFAIHARCPSAPHTWTDRAWMANGTEAEYCAWTATMAQMAASGSWNGCEMPLRASAKSTACRAVMCNTAGFTRAPGAGHGSVHTLCERAIVVGLSSFLQGCCHVSIARGPTANQRSC